MNRGLRTPGWRAITLLLAALLGSAAIAGVLAKWAGLTWLVTAVLSGVAVMLAGAGALIVRWHEGRAGERRLVRRHVQAARGSELPSVSEVTLEQLRVHPAVVVLPYLKRPVKELEVAGHLAAGKPVLLVGSSMVGKTRLAAEFVKARYPERSILIPDNAGSLAALDNADVLLRDCVVWLDDLERLLIGGAVTPGLLARLAESNVVVATIRAHEWDRFQPTDVLRSPEWDVLRLFTVVTLDRARDAPSPSDLALAVPDEKERERIAAVGIGEFVGAAELVLAQLEIGPQSSPLGYGLVRGAADWYRAGLARPVPPEVLRRLAEPHVSERDRARLPTGEPGQESKEYTAALAWATRQVNPTVSLLLPTQEGYSLYDFALDGLASSGDSVPAENWHLVIAEAHVSELATIGFLAWANGDESVAETAWRRGASEGEPQAIYNLGRLLELRDDTDEALVLYRQVTDTDPEAANNLANLLKEKGDLAGAEHWYRFSAEAGQDVAMNNLAILLKQRGDLAEADSWYRRAIALDNADAMANLAALLHRRGERAEAEEWLRKVAGAGHVGGMYNLAVLLAERGDADEAEEWFARVASA